MGVKVVLADCAVATAAGGTLDDLWATLRRGESVVGPVSRFSTERLEYTRAACMRELDDAPDSERLRPLMARSLDRLRPPPPDAFVIWTGVKSAAEYIERTLGGAEPRRWPGGPWRPEEFRRWTAERLGLDPEAGMEINAACAASTVGLALGADMIARGEQSSVLVAAADIVSHFTFTGFSALKALSPDAARPFDAGRDGLTLGDGAAAILLTSEELARERGLDADVALTGWGIANDATHITAPARDGRGLIAAIRSALEQARLAPEDIEAFCAHGTGTVYNDAMELTSLDAVFGKRRFPVFSVKGAIGHTLGAAGGVEAGLCARALREGAVPGTVGLREPEERAVGRVSTEARTFLGRRILTTNSGFGGVNAALVLERDSSPPRTPRSGEEVIRSGSSCPS